MRKIVSFLKRNFYLCFLVALFGLIAVLNYQPYKWFTGWDNLHPEFNLFTNIKRAIFGVWQEHQGLGHVGGHGYASTLPHSLIISLLSSILPAWSLRQTFSLITLLLGSLGCFALFNYLARRQQPAFRQTGALLAGLFYMLNFATIQQFYVQLEAFVIHFMALPWLIFLAFSLLDKWSRKKLAIFLLVSFFTSTQGFIPPLFLTYVVCLAIILASYWFSKPSWQRLKKALIIGTLTFCVNAYWFLPFFHYTLTQSNVYLNSYNNILSTESWIEKNNLYGTIKDLAILRGFPSQLNDKVNGQTIYIFQPWHDHFEKTWVLCLGYGFFGIIVLGFLAYIKSCKSKYKRIALPVFFILVFTVLASQVPVFSFASSLIQKLPVFRQAFRASFTKLSIALSLGYSLFFSYGAVFLIKKIYQLVGKGTRWIIYVCTGLIAGLIFLFSLPIFKGNLFYKKAQLKIPQQYFDLFSFFQKQKPNSRTAVLYQGEHWGWDYFRWGYTGSGFLWFGIQQPILERAFDVWSNYNENYYWELIHALYAEDWSLFDQLLEKYQVEWLIFDKNIIPYSEPKFTFYIDSFEKYLDQTQKCLLAAEFNSSDSQPIKVYHVNINTSLKDSVFLVSDLPQVNSYSWNNEDTAFLDYGHYLSVNHSVTQSLSHSIFYPFRSLFTGRKQEELEFQVEDKGDNFIFSSSLFNFTNKSTLFIPNLVSEEAVFWTKELKEEPIATPSVSLERNKVAVRIEKKKGYLSYDSKEDDYFLKKAENRGFFRFSSGEEQQSYDIVLDSLVHKTGYLIKIESRNLEGKSLQVSLINYDSERVDIEINLPKNKEFNTSYLVVPPMKYYGRGYSLRFDNFSTNRQKTMNDLARVEVYPIPYRFLKSIKLISPDSNSSILNSEFLTLNSVSHPNPSFYKISLDSQTLKVSKSQSLILSQSFNSGWKAFYFQGKPFLSRPIFLKDHILVNNWQNGWVLSPSDLTIYLFFWPQFLEYLGFVLFILSGLILIFKWPRLNHKHYLRSKLATTNTHLPKKGFNLPEN